MEAQENAIARVSQLTQTLKNRLSASGISKDGISYITMVADPFHDTEINIVGMPDEVRARSIVYDIRADYTISKPAGETGNWDAHISFLPYAFTWPKDGRMCHHCQMTVDTGFPANPGVSAIEELPDLGGSPAVYPWKAGGPIWVQTSTAGLNTFDPTVVGGYREQFTSSMLGSTDDQLHLGPLDSVRLIGAAFEVRNTTAEINKQGAVICYRQKMVSDEYSLVHEPLFHGGAVNTIFAQKEYRVLSGPPCSAEQAKRLGGVTMEAREGCLVPCVLDFSENAPLKFNSENILIACNSNRNTDEEIHAVVTEDAFTFDIVLNGDGTPFMIPSQSQRPGSVLELPFSNSGAYFTGLSNESTLTLTTRFFVEVFPAPFGVNFAIARPSPAYDPQVPKILDLLMGDLLPGYPVSMNAKGDFFKKLVSKVAGAYNKISPIVFSAMEASPVPQVAQAGTAMRLVDAGGRQLATIAKNAAKKKKKPQSSKKK